jgi:hypothetical protein
MLLYHNTFPESAAAVVATGFRDRVHFYMTPTRHRGVWFIDKPEFCPDPDDRRSIWLVVDLPDEVVRRYEWVAEGSPYREFLIPAQIVNRYSRPTRVEVS